MHVWQARTAERLELRQGEITIGSGVPPLSDRARTVQIRLPPSATADARVDRLLQRLLEDVEVGVFKPWPEETFIWVERCARMRDL